MPALPCLNCKALVDTNDPTCRKCNDKQPFECSKCSVRMGNRDIFEPEKLTFKKSIFCMRCGPEEQVVQCQHCKTGLIRSSGRSRTGKGGRELVYHLECWTTYEKLDRYSKLVFALGIPVAAVLFGLIAGVITHDSGKGINMAFVGAAVMGLIGLLVRPRG